jgi:hypothetical protein
MFLNDWKDKRSMIIDFAGLGHWSKEEKIKETEKSFEHVEVLLASYGYENYSGDAFVLFRDTRDGKLYEVHGGHCSCYGLEDQWDPELTDVDSLKHRLEQGNLGDCSYSGNMFAEELKTLLGELK